MNSELAELISVTFSDDSFGDRLSQLQAEVKKIDFFLFPDESKLGH